ncbi:SPFH domain-containing protein [Streptomyces sp. J15]|uniref:SPFH domain-containing protein n=1 Tax=Streptomyces pakalii TaxID=3036494 RepID=A0ABT7DE85_9ACTN|nr:SPFH domain-containing protein [Streptomyces pakalii]MDJ1643174.1 SPFH domain-containing protein [Streptomyces pakalii]
MSLHLGPVPDRPDPGLLAPEGAAAGRPASTSGRAAADRPASTSGRPAADGPAPASERPGAEGRGSGSGRPAPDGPAPISARPGAGGPAPASARPATDSRGPVPARAAAADGPASAPASSAAEGRGPVSGRPATDGRGPVPARAAADGPASAPASSAAEGRGSASGRPAADGPAPISERPGSDGRGPVSGRPATDGRGPVPARAAADGPASAPATSAADGRGSASGRPAADGPAADGPARTPASPAADESAPTSARPATGAPTRPAPLDGNLHLQPVRRLRTEPSAEWTPHPSYGAEPESPKRESRGDAGPDTELDLVLDLAPGDRAASATFSVPAPTAASVTATASATATTGTSANPGRRHSVIANETTASIPVHLLFRDDQEPADGAAALPGPGAVVHRPAGDRAPATRRPPVPRSPQTRVRPSTRPAPVADPRLSERPGPALSGYAALLAGAAGTAGALAVLWWRGVLPAGWQSAVGLTPRPDLGIGAGAWAALALLATVVLLALGGLGRGRVGYAWVLTLFGDYRGSVRRTGLVWVSPLLLRRRVDVRLRHWRSEPLPAVDANGTALRVVVLVVWRIKDTVRAVLGIEDHEAYLSAQVEAAMARVLSQLPADAFHEDAPTLRDAEAVGDALTRMLKADCEPVGVEVYSAQPTGIEYAPEVAAAMQRRRIAAIDSKHRDSVLTSVVDAVDDTVNRLTTRGIVELDDYERKALVKDLTVAFYTGRSGGGDGA